MTQFFSDAKDFISDRIGSPFWLSTIVSWLLWNWRVPVTALFESDTLTVAYLESYFHTTSICYHLILPLASGFLYATLSGSFRETLEIAAKIVYDKIAKLDSRGKLYNTVSTEKHHKKVKILERQIQRISERVSDSEEISTRNDSLQTEIENRKNREQELVDIIKENAIDKNIDDAFKKLRFLKMLHEKGFALTISEEELNKENFNNPYSLEELTQEERNNRVLAEVSEISYDHMQETKERYVLGNTLSNYSELKDPSSKATILATLMLAKSRSQINQNIPPSALGLDNNVFETCFQKLEKSNLVMIKGGKTLVTNSGSDRLNNLRSELKESDLVVAIDSLRDVVKSNIMQLLTSKSLSQNELYENVVFHPDLPVIIQELKNTDSVQKEGELLFSNHQLKKY